MNVIESIDHPDLLGGWSFFRDNPATKKAWRAAFKTADGIPMDAEELALFRLCTVLDTPQPGGYKRIVWSGGVQQGKTSALAARLSHSALFGKAGETVIVMSQDLRASVGTLFRKIREIFETIPAFRAEVIRMTSDSIELKTGVVILALPCRPDAARGKTVCAWGSDEFGFYPESEGRDYGEETLRVAAGRVTTTSGQEYYASSPNFQGGALWRLHEKYYGVADPRTVIWSAPSVVMNPTISREFLAQMEGDDPVTYRREFLGEYPSAKASAFCDSAIVAASVDSGVRERPPSPQFWSDYAGFADPSSGSGADSFTVAVSHRDGDKAVLDCVREWSPPFSPDQAIREASALLKTYGLSVAIGDRYAANFVVEGFAKSGIAYRHSERDRSAVYMEMLHALNAGRLALLDHSEMLRQLRSLERRRGAGHDKIDHPRGGHDDLINSAAGALTIASGPRPYTFREVSWPGGEPMNGRFGTLIYKDSRPWAGVCPADLDHRGRPINLPAIFQNGKIVGFIKTETRKGESTS